MSDMQLPGRPDDRNSAARTTKIRIAADAGQQCLLKRLIALLITDHNLSELGAEHRAVIKHAMATDIGFHDAHLGIDQKQSRGDPVQGVSHRRGFDLVPFKDSSDSYRPSKVWG